MTWTVDDHLAAAPDNVIVLYERFVALMTACGPFSYSVSKSAITLKGTRRGFAGAVPKIQSLNGYLDLQRRVEDVRITNSTPYSKRLFVHTFRVTELHQLDDQFAEWVGEAYAVGAGAHIAT